MYTLENVNSKRIIMAREARGINQAELAAKISITNGYLSKIERGDGLMNEMQLQKVADITGFPMSFFFQSGDIVAENLSFRKREKVPQRFITPITAKANIIRLQVQFLLHELKLQPVAIPAIEVTETMTPNAIAAEVRRRWAVDTPVVDNMTALLEAHDIPVSSFSFVSERIDSRCMLTESGQPVIFINSLMLGDRQRFSLAFELGNLVMHTFFTVPLDRNIVHEANLFAAEFLMPEAEIRADFSGDINVALLGELKRKWKVSMIALLYRADDLGLLTPNQKRYLLQQFNLLQIRRREPQELDVPVERPQLLRSWVATLKAKRKLNTAQAAEMLYLKTPEFIELYS